MKDNQVRRTFILVKPDAVERKLTGEILRRFERKGFTIVATSLRWISNEFAQEHYAEHKSNSTYFKQMCDAISKGPSLAVILEGSHAVAGTRQLIGNQQPIGGSAVGTIRGDFGIEAPFNLVHGSDGDHSAQREITMWFGKEFYAPTPPKQEVAPAPVGILSPPKKGPVKLQQAKGPKATFLEQLYPQEYPAMVQQFVVSSETTDQSESMFTMPVISTSMTPSLWDGLSNKAKLSFIPAEDAEGEEESPF